MTDEVLEALQERLMRKLGMEEPEEEEITLMEDELLDAEAEILLELNMDELDDRMLGKVVDLAAVYYRYDMAQEDGVQSRSYAEGQISESEKRFSPGEYRQAVREILDSLSRYRRVTC